MSDGRKAKFYLPEVARCSWCAARKVCTTVLLDGVTPVHYCRACFDMTGRTLYRFKHYRPGRLPALAGAVARGPLIVMVFKSRDGRSRTEVVAVDDQQHLMAEVAPRNFCCHGWLTFELWADMRPGLGGLFGVG